MDRVASGIEITIDERMRVGAVLDKAIRRVHELMRGDRRAPHSIGGVDTTDEPAASSEIDGLATRDTTDGPATSAEIGGSSKPDVVDGATKPKHAWWWVAILVVGGGIGLYVAAPDTAVLRAAWARLADVPFAAIAIIVGGAIGLVATEALRIAVIGRLVGARVHARDAWDAAVANHVMTAVTPQVGLGEPTVAYTLAKRGVPWDAAVAIPFVKFTTSLALVFALGTVLVATGFGPHVDSWKTTTAIVWFGGIAAITIVVLAIVSNEHLATRWIARMAHWAKRRRVFASAAWQMRIERGAEVTRRTVERLARVRGAKGVGDDRVGDDRVGDNRVEEAHADRHRRISPLAAAFALIAVHLVYYASYIAPLVGLALVLGDPPLGALCLRALVYLCFVFAMPTPGGVGPSEAAAAWFFGDLVAPADAIVIVVVFRASTFYLQLAIGALYLPIRKMAR